MKKHIQELRNRIREISYIQEAIALMEWDLRTGAPRKGHALRAEAIGHLAARAHALATAPEMGEWLNSLIDPTVYSTLSEIDKAIVRVQKKDYDQMQRIPNALFHEFQTLSSTAQSVWEDAKAQSDFSLLQPYLEKLVTLKTTFIDHWGYEEHPYNRLLDQFEPGMTVTQLDNIFQTLRKELVPLVQAIGEKGQPYDASKFARTYGIEQQKRVNWSLLTQMGYDFSAGRIDTTVHPFQTTLNHFDVRVTTNYDERDLRKTMFGTMHEGGHALYEMGVSEELIGTNLCSGTSMGIHESQSRFWENMIGRSLPFWQQYYPLLTETFAEPFTASSFEDFMGWINHVEPTLIRTESDEVTYNLHIMVRYEIEKGLFGGQYAVRDLPELWREKMQEYLGVVPKNDGEGVLQDVHWSAGDFGYFPSYALGNLYAAQFRDTLYRAIPGVEEDVREGRLDVIRAWLRDQIHQYGRMQDPAEIVQRVTGAPLSGTHLVSYLQDKFTKIYNL